MTAARRLLPALVFVVAAAAYAPALRFDFVDWDDHATVLENPILELGLGPELVRRAFEPREANWIPLTWLSLAVDRALFGLDPAGAHAVNALWHAATAALLCAVLARATGAPLPALLVALSFALHPLRVESVAWVTERKDVLSGFFFVACVGAWLAYGRRPSAARYAAALLAAMLSLGAKATAVTLPFVLLLLDFWPLARLGDAGSRRRALLEKLPFAALAAGVSVLTVVAQERGGAFGPLADVPIDVRLGNAVVSYFWYVEKAFWPTELAAFYPHPRVLPDANTLGLVLFAGTAATLAALALARRRPWLCVGWLWFLGMLVPMIGIVQVGTQARADRYAYLPMLGLEIALAFELWAWLGRRPATRALYAALVAGGAVALALATRSQASHWRSNEALFARALAVTESNYLAYDQVGRARLAAGDADAAARHFAEALRIEPRWARARGGLAQALWQQGLRDEAIWNHREAVRTDPADGSLRLALANALVESGWNDDAIQELRLGVRLSRPRFVPALRAALAVTLARRGDYAAARKQALRAIEADPKLARTNALLERLSRVGSDAAGDEAVLREALEHDSNAAHLHARLGQSLQRQGRDAEAIAAYRSALALDGALPDARNNLAWLLAASRDAAVRRPDEALRLAEEAARASGPRDASVLDTLAVAQAANGRFDEALATLDRAQALLGPDATALAAGIAERRDRFAAREPWIDGAAAR